MRARMMTAPMLVMVVAVVGSAIATAQPTDSKRSNAKELLAAVAKGTMSFRQMYLEQMDSAARSQVLSSGGSGGSGGSGIVQAYELDPFAVERFNGVFASLYAKTPEVMAAEQQCHYTEEQIRESLRPRRTGDEERSVEGSVVMSGLSPACDTLIAYYTRQMANVPVWKMVVVVRRESPKAEPTVLGTVGIVNTPLQGIFPRDIAASLAGRPYLLSVLNADALRTIPTQELMGGLHVNGSMRHVSSYATMFDYVQAMVRVLPKTLNDLVREQQASTKTSAQKANKATK